MSNLGWLILSVCFGKWFECCSCFGARNEIANDDNLHVHTQFQGFQCCTKIAHVSRNNLFPLMHALLLLLGCLLVVCWFVMVAVGGILGGKATLFQGRLH